MDAAHCCMLIINSKQYYQRDNQALKQKDRRSFQLITRLSQEVGFGRSCDRVEQYFKKINIIKINIIMAAIIDNAFFHSSARKNEQTSPVPKQDARFFIEGLLNNSPLEKLDWAFKPATSPHTVKLGVLFDSPVYPQGVGELSFNLQLQAARLEMCVVRRDGLVRMYSKGKVSAMCRLIQKYNLHLSQFNLAFRIDPNNGLLLLTNPATYYPDGLQTSHLLQLNQLALRNYQLIKEQIVFLLECGSQKFEWQVYLRDPRYMDKVHADMMETMRIRELIALSSIKFEHSPNEVQGRYQTSKELINFLSHRESMVNPTLKLQGFIGGQLTLFSHFLQAFYFAKTPMQLEKLQSQFTKQFEPLFEKFQMRRMANGDNPYLFNTILIKNEHKVELLPTNCQGGFSKVSVAEMEIAYTESQSPVLELPQLGATNQPQKKGWADDFQVSTKKPIVYFSKVVAVKINKNQTDYEKIRHQKAIVQHFRTTTSPFILKYYSCTQKRFKYRQYLLMDYLGPTLSLSEYATLHRNSFSVHSKMHIFIHLANALNYLEKQMVVHMDLSSHNIMVCKDLLVKVIDFGEAYHPFLDSQKNSKYLPGHTLPYCPPETFNRIKKFTSKSDVFTVGMILYRVLFNDFPFFPTSELKEGYAGREYLSKWMLAPERVEQWGYESGLLLLLQVVGRCLQTQESRRPTPFWLFVILNKIFLSFK